MIVTSMDERSDPVCPVLDGAEANVVALYSYWRKMARGRRWPERGEIDPVDIPLLLPDIMLVTLEDGGHTFFFRLAGTRVAFGRDPTGKRLHEAAPAGPYRAHILDLYTRAAAAKSPVFTAVDYGYTEEFAPKSIERLFLPLGPASGTADGLPGTLMVCQVAKGDAPIHKSAWQLGPGVIQEKVFAMLPAPD